MLVSQCLGRWPHAHRSAFSTEVSPIQSPASMGMQEEGSRKKLSSTSPKRRMKLYRKSRAETKGNQKNCKRENEKEP